MRKIPVIVSIPKDPETTPYGFSIPDFPEANGAVDFLEDLQTAVKDTLYLLIEEYGRVPPRKLNQPYPDVKNTATLNVDNTLPSVLMNVLVYVDIP